MRRMTLLFGTVIAALVLAGGTAMALTAMQCGDGECLGTDGSDLMRGTDGYNQMRAGDGDDVLRGFASPDSLRGEGGNDRLFGGRTGDSLEGGPGDDHLVGAAGDDDYDLNGYGWGHDTIFDRAVFDSDIRTGNLLWLDHYGGEDVVVDLVSGEGPEVRSASGADTADWENDVVDGAIDLSRGDDRIRGNARANLLAAFYGDNAVRAGGGDDHVDVGDGDGGDTVRCGKGEDVVIRDAEDPASGNPGDVIAADCEVEHDPAVIVPAAKDLPFPKKR